MAARTRFAFVFWMAVAVAVTILGNQTVDGRAGRSESIGCADCGAGNDLPLRACLKSRGIGLERRDGLCGVTGARKTRLRRTCI